MKIGVIGDDFTGSSDIANTLARCLAVPLAEICAFLAGTPPKETNSRVWAASTSQP